MDLFPKGVVADTSKGEYLVKITNQKSYDFGKDIKKYKGYKVAVTAIDRCWNESESFSLTL